MEQETDDSLRIRIWSIIHRADIINSEAKCCRDLMRRQTTTPERREWAKGKLAELEAEEVEVRKPLRELRLRSCAIQGIEPAPGFFVYQPKP